MLRLIAGGIERLVPAALHRALLPLAHRLRHRWRRWRGAPLTGCVVVIENPAGEVLLLLHSYGPRQWMLPGGGVASGEDPGAAARREIAEELALDLDRLERVAVIAEEISGSPHTAHLFAARTDVAPRPDGREVLKARFFALDALPRPLGEILRRRLELWQTRARKA